MTKTFKNIDIENFPAFIKMEDARFAIKAAKKDLTRAKDKKTQLEATLANTTDKATIKNLKAQIAQVRVYMKECNEDIKNYWAEQCQWAAEVEQIKVKYGIAD